MVRYARPNMALTAMVEITHPDKVLFPAGKFTKADLIKFYAD